MLADPDGATMELSLETERYVQSGGAFKVKIHAPYALINKTGLDFALKTKAPFDKAKNIAGINIFSPDPRRKLQSPFLFSHAHGTEQKKNRVVLRVGDSDWSSLLSFEAVGTDTAVTMPSATKTEAINVGIRVAEGIGAFKLTKVITLYPRYLVQNDHDSPIRIGEPGGGDVIVLQPGERRPLFWLRRSDEPQLSVAFDPDGKQWTAPVSLHDIGRLHATVPPSQRGTMMRLARFDVLLSGPSVFVRVAIDADAKWPYLIRNLSDVAFSFGQADPDEDEYARARSTKLVQGAKPVSVGPHGEARYAWDRPAAGERMLRLLFADRTRLVDPLEIGAQEPLVLGRGADKAMLAIDVRADGPTQVITIAPYVAEENVYKLQRRDTALSRSNSTVGGASTSGLTFEPEAVANVTTLGAHLVLEGIGLSVVNKRMREVVYLSLRGLELHYADSTASQTIRASVKWIQVDNQLPGTDYPLLLYPTVIPANSKALEAKPNLEALVVLLKDQDHGVLFLKDISVLLQEMSVEADEDFIFTALDFAHLDLGAQPAQLSQLTDEPADVPTPEPERGGSDLFIENFSIQPIVLNLSFQRSDTPDSQRPPLIDARSPLGFLLNGITMALGNVSNAPIKLNALAMHNVRAPPGILIGRIQQHYTQAAISRFQCVRRSL